MRAVKAILDRALAALALLLDAKIVLATFTTFFRPPEQPVEDTMNIERARARQQG